jgi:hypothetical protein
MSFTRYQLVLLTIAVCLGAICLGRLAEIGILKVANAAHVAVHVDE